MSFFRLLGAMALLGLGGCGGGGSGSEGTPPPAANVPTFTASAGIAQKGPLILGSTVTAQELSATLAPTGKQYSYQTSSDFGTFNPNSAFTSQYIGVNATGYYFDETRGRTSTAPITLSGYTDLSATSVMNVNLLTTLAYKRIEHLVANSGMSFAAAQEQAENTVLAALGVPGNYGRLGSLDISSGTEGGKMLAALSALFCQGNDPGNLAALIANIQQDIAVNGGITSNATIATLRSSAQALNAAAVAEYLNQKYASSGLTYTAADISSWLDQDGDGLTGRFEFRVSQASQSSVFTLPAALVEQHAGKSVSVSSGRLVVNAVEVTGAATLQAGDIVTISPPPGQFPTGVAHVYLLAGATKLARVSFLSELQSLVLSPANASIPVNAQQHFTVTGVFSDGRTADMTSVASWTSSAPDVATIVSVSATGVWPGTATITATVSNVSGSTTLTVTRAPLQSISVAPSSLALTRGGTRQLTATGHFADGTTASLTSRAVWSSANTSIATVTGGLVTGVATGSTTVTVTAESVSTSTPVAVTGETWTLAPPTPGGPRMSHTATLLPDGRVFIALGIGRGICCLDDSYIYNPATNTYTAVADAPVYAQNHATILLPDGRLMVISGDNNGLLISSMIYDFATNAWTYGPSMSHLRSNHTAVTMNTGKTLIVGGSRPPELYDPVANAFSLASSTGAPTNADSATLLPDGRVLVLTGNAVTIYDPASDTWTAGAAMSVARWQHAAVLLADGRVLVTGGGNAMSSAEIYDPAANSWAAAASMTYPQRGGTATRLLNGTVLVVSQAYNDFGEPTSGPAKAQIYNPTTNSWSAAPDMNFAHTDFTATLLPNGAVFVLGGYYQGELYQ